MIHRTYSFLLGGSTLLLLMACGCAPEAKTAPPSATPPAKVAQVAREDQLNTITLTPKAAERLGITLAAVERRTLPRARVYGGEVTLPAGASLIVSAPLAGTLQAPPGKTTPKVGATVTDKQPVFGLLPLLSAERAVLTPIERINYAQARNAIAQSQIDAAAQVQQASVQVEAAQIALDRAERLLREQAGTARTVDEARAQHDLANQSLQAARDRKKLVDNITLDASADPGKLQPLVMPAPQAGIVRVIHAAVGEVVAAGAPLFEVMQCDPLWIRVPVYVGELADLDEQAPARVSSLADALGARALVAKPVSAPPTAVALASTVDLYYAAPNAKGELRPGQRMSVQLQLRGRREDRVIPWSAVMHDINGGTWVYEQTAPETFVRRRVQVLAVVDDLAVLNDGPAEGANIVTAGAVELFGAEFGFAK